jgi:phosphoribosylanthranilate isomerase
VRAPRLKQCGLTRLEDALVAADTGAWALGVILWSGSPRACTLDEAAAISAALRRRAEIVGVFVDATLDEVAHAVDAASLSMVQLHGNEGAAYAREVQRRTGAKVIKAARVGGRADIQAMERFHTDFHLLDARVEGVQGGTGETFDWELVRQRMTDVPLIVAGGLSAENVGEAIASTHPYAVDVASWTESSPGVKDHDKLRAFAEAVRATAVEAA